jgi:hypothetical protein
LHRSWRGSRRRWRRHNHWRWWRRRWRRDRHNRRRRRGWRRGGRLWWRRRRRRRWRGGRLWRRRRWRRRLRRGRWRWSRSSHRCRRRFRRFWRVHAGKNSLGQGQPRRKIAFAFPPRKINRRVPGKSGRQVRAQHPRMDHGPARPGSGSAGQKALILDRIGRPQRNDHLHPAGDFLHRRAVDASDLHRKPGLPKFLTEKVCRSSVRFTEQDTDVGHYHAPDLKLCVPSAVCRRSYHLATSTADYNHATLFAEQDISETHAPLASRARSKCHRNHSAVSPEKRFAPACGFATRTL